jgi:NADPH2:quinone reductase
VRRVVCEEFGPVEDLRVVEEPDPVPGDGEVLVAVEAAGVSFVDGLIARGLYQLRPALPYTPGMGLAGRVTRLGPGAIGPRPGTRVAGLMSGFGAYASHVTAPAAAVVPLPDGVDPAVAATALENYGTLLFAVEHRVRIAPGEQVVVLGAGGGIGLAAVDVARAAGARVVAAASSEDKRAAALAAGAAQAIGYGEGPGDLKDAIRAATGGGADVVVDPVGGPSAEGALRALAAGGRYCVLGFAGGEIPRLPANIVLLCNRTVVGVDWGDWLRTRPADAAALAATMLDRVARGELHPPVPALHPLDDAGRVLGLIAARAVTGKIALVP